MKRWKSTLFIIVFLLLAPASWVSAETLEDQMNNLIGPQQQYSTKLSPVFLRTHTTNESINPQNGEFSLVQNDYVLPGRNGLDLEITRIYKNGSANIKEMSVQYVNGAWVDKVEYSLDTATFYENRYNLGIGMRLSFPSIEIKENSDKTTYQYLHTDSGDVYRLRPVTMNGEVVQVPDGQTIKDVVVRESDSFKNGQPDGVSKFVMSGNDGKKTYFDKDGVILGIEDRFGNRIVFENQKFEYKVGSKSVTKKLITKITDTVGRVVTIEYKEDAAYKVKKASDTAYEGKDSYKNSQNPDKNNSGDLEGKFQVIIHLPDGNNIVYDKTAALVDSSGHVLRTRLQRVFDTDGLPKYHFWYEQADLGFTFKNKEKYSVYNRYESLSQIDYVKTNRVTRYTYDKFKQTLSDDGTMEYLKLFEKRELEKTGYDKSKSKFEDRFIVQVKNKSTYTYTNGADGYGTEGYDKNDYDYLKDKYRYYTLATDAIGGTTKYTYDGLHQLLVTEKNGKDHKEVIYTDRDSLKLVSKSEIVQYDVRNGTVSDKKVHRIENFQYDEYGNLTHYTGPEAPRNGQGTPLNADHTVVYSYDYNKYHALTSKTWKQDRNQTAQVVNQVDGKGNVTKETRIQTDDEKRWIITEYDYDTYGNLTEKRVSSNGKTFATRYEYGTDANGLDVKGAYLTRESGFVSGKETEIRHAYDFKTGNRIAEVDGKGNRITYKYDKVNRVLETAYPDGGKDTFAYKENGFANFVIQHIDAGNTAWQFEYDITGALLKESIGQGNDIRLLGAYEYDSLGRKTKETDSNGNQTRFEYDSASRLVKRSAYDKQNALKGASTMEYRQEDDANTPYSLVITDEEGNKRKYVYDILNRVVKTEEYPASNVTAARTNEYDFAGYLVKETDANGNSTHYSYDSTGRQLSKRDALGNETRFEYIGANLISAIYEPGGKVTSFIYDAYGRQLEKRTLAQGSEDYDYEANSYDVNGNITRSTTGQWRGGKNIVATDVSYEYDVMNRLSAEKAAIDTARTGLSQYTYDKRGNLVSLVQYADAAKSKYRKYDYSYDYAGRITGESGVYRVDLAGGRSEEYGAYQTVYDRDLEGNVLQEKRFNGQGWDVTTLKYDYLNHVVEKVEPYQNNPTGKIAKYAYDKTGRLVTETHRIQGADVTTGYAYDGMGRLVRKTDPLGNATRYVYDNNGNKLKEIDSRYSAVAEATAPGIVNEYNALNQLVKTSAYDGRTSTVLSYMRYDARGNVILKADGEGYNNADPSASFGTRYTYDVLNRPISETTPAVDQYNRKNAASHASRTLVYDGAGKVVQETDAYGNTYRYAYFLNGLLKEKSYPDGTKETYDYDLTGKAWSSFQSRNGVKTETSMNIFDKPYRVQYPDGTHETMSYSPRGHMTGAVDKAGQSHQFTYDAAGNLLVQLDFVSANKEQSVFKRVEHIYDEANRLLSMETFLATEKKSDGSVKIVSAGDKTSYQYDKAGQLLRVEGPDGREQAFTYDRAGNAVMKKVLVSGNDYDVTRYTYDLLNQVASETVLVRLSDLAQEELKDATFDDAYPDRVWSTTRYTYNKNMQVASMTDAKGHTTKYEYDLNNQLIKTTDPLQAVTEYRYDLLSRMTEEKNANGVSNFYEYDAEGRLLREIKPAADGTMAVKRYVYDAVGNVVKEVSPNQYNKAQDNAVSIDKMPGTNYRYDVMNRRISSSTSGGAVIEAVSYDALGRVSKVVEGPRYSGDAASSKGTVFIYDGLNREIQRTDAMGYVTSKTYDILGNVIQDKDARGNVSRHAYNADGTLRQSTYADGSTISYTYDKLGRKLSETNPLGATTGYAYDSFGQEKTVTDALGFKVEYKIDLTGNPVSIKDQKGSVKLYKYDANRNMIEERTPLEKDTSGNIIYAVKSYVYDPVGQLLRETLTSSKDASFVRESVHAYYSNGLLRSTTDNSGASVRYEYDKNGNKVRSETLRTAGLFDIEKHSYDEFNRVVQDIRLVKKEDLDPQAAGLAEADSQDQGYIRLVTSYSYDVLGNKMDDYDGRGNRTVYKYDDLNRLTSVTQKVNGRDATKRYAYNEAGLRTSETSELGHTSTYAYDAMNRLISSTDPLGGTVAYTYDLAGNKLTEKNANGNIKSYMYDELNRLTTVKDSYNHVITKNVYDEAGLIVKVIDARGYASANSDGERYGAVSEYNLAGRLIAETDREGYRTIYRYNPAGDLVEKTNPEGETYRYEYDAAGRLVRVIDPLGTETSYSYDLSGNKLDMVDGKGKLTRYEYGAFGIVRSITDADRKRETYTYDLALNIAELTDAIGNHTRYEYDNRNLLLKKSVIETGDNIQFEYDAAGNRTTMTDESGKTSYVYDKNNRQTSIAKDGKAYLSYSYDAGGNIVSVTDKKNHTTVYTYDKSERMATAASAGKTTAYAYDVAGNRISVTYAGGVTEEYSFDRNNQLIKLLNKKPDGSLLSAYTYTYDGAGRQTQKADSYGTTTYAYDDAGRVTKVTAPGKTVVYAYDRNGNRASMHETYTSAQPSGYTDVSNGKSVTYMVKKSEYVYSAANVLQQLTEKMLDDQGDETLEKKTVFLYDDNGNELRRQTSYIRPHDRDMMQVTGANPNGEDITGELYALLEKTTNVFDGFNRLERAERIQGGVRSTVEYTYDGDGMRTRKESQSSKDSKVEVTNYVYDRQYVILETDGSDNTAVRYVRGTHYISRTDATGQLSYFLFNGHGDVVQTVSASGQVENQYDYDIFGNPILSVEVYASSIRYAGEFYDAEVGLYYLRARYYDPQLGRFISEDTYRGQDNDPLSLNLYTYVHNDPINFYDPTGRWKQGDDTLDADSKAKIIALTNAYFIANSPEERKKISQAADKVREDYHEALRKNEVFVTPLQVRNNDQLNLVVNLAKGHNGTFNADQWSNVLQLANITVSNPDVTQTEGQVYSPIRNITTHIGRTDIAVNTAVSSKTANIIVKVDMTYQLTSNEELFVKQVNALRQPNEYISLDQIVAVLDTLELNNKKITDKQLEGILGAGNFSTRSSSLFKQPTGELLELVYKASITSTTLAEVDLKLQEQKILERLGLTGKQLSSNSKFSSYRPSNATATSTNLTFSNSPLKRGTTFKEVYAKNKGCNCFTAGTKVVTEDGEKNIEDIMVGDMVLAKNEETDEITYKEVTHLYRNDKEVIYELTVGNQVIETTDNHPFWVVNQGWVFAADLQVRDKLLQSNGNVLTIDNIKIVKHDDPIEVYNFTVADFHTYFVSDLRIWVHNTSCEVMKVWDLEGTGDAITKSKIKDITENMKKNGWVGEPIEIFEINGKNLIVNGHHRAKAARQAGINDVPVKKLTEKELKEQYNRTPEELLNDYYYGG